MKLQTCNNCVWHDGCPYDIPCEDYFANDYYIELFYVADLKMRYESYMEVVDDYGDGTSNT